MIRVKGQGFHVLCQIGLQTGRDYCEVTCHGQSSGSYRKIETYFQGQDKQILL